MLSHFQHLHVSQIQDIIPLSPVFTKEYFPKWAVDWQYRDWHRVQDGDNETLRNTRRIRIKTTTAKQETHNVRYEDKTYQAAQYYCRVSIIEIFRKKVNIIICNVEASLERTASRGRRQVLSPLQSCSCTEASSLSCSSCWTPESHSLKVSPGMGRSYQAHHSEVFTGETIQHIVS